MKTTMRMTQPVLMNRTPERVSLHCQQVFSIRNRKPALEIQGVKGVVYVTLPDDQEDYMLRPGDRLVVKRRGTVVVQGMPEGIFQYG